MVFGRAQIAIKLIIPYVFLMIWNSSPESPQIPGIPGNPHLSPYQVSGAAAQDLPSTRAGDQDDVSSKQTP